MSEEKNLMVGMGLVVGAEWKPKAFTRAGARKYMDRTMKKDLKKSGFTAVVADCGGYWRGSYGKSLEGAPWRR